MAALDTAAAEKLIADGVISGGMVPKVRSGLHALSWSGGEAVIADGAAHAALSRALDDPCFGTRLRAAAGSAPRGTPAAAGMSRSSTAIWTHMRFSAWSRTTLCGPVQDLRLDLLAAVRRQAVHHDRIRRVAEQLRGHGIGTEGIPAHLGLGLLAHARPHVRVDRVGARGHRPPDRAPSSTVAPVSRPSAMARSTMDGSGSYPGGVTTRTFSPARPRPGSGRRPRCCHRRRRRAGGPRSRRAAPGASARRRAPGRDARRR